MSKTFKIGDRVKLDPNNRSNYGLIKPNEVYTVSGVGVSDKYAGSKPNFLKLKDIKVDFYAYNPDNFILVEPSFEVGDIVTSTYPVEYHKAIGYSPPSLWYTTEKKFRIVEKEADIDYNGLQWYGVKAFDDLTNSKTTNRFPAVDLTKVEKEVVNVNGLYKTKKTFIGGTVVINSHTITITPYNNGSIAIAVDKHVWSKNSLKEYAKLLNEIADSE